MRGERGQVRTSGLRSQNGALSDGHFANQGQTF